MSHSTAKKNDWLIVLFIITVALIIFYPLFFSEYAYTDELVGLAQFGKGTSSHSLLVYGRYVTEKLAEWLFGSATTIRQITGIRLFSLAGWIVSIPVWYYIIKKVIIKEKLPASLAFFSTLYLICTPPVAIYVGWAACFELFLANTAGLVSGYWLYAGIRWQPGRIEFSRWQVTASVVAGILSLFTYQNGFGCFLLPFLLHLLANPQKWRLLVTGIGGYFFIAIVYYLLFKYSLSAAHLGATGRTSLHINVFNKLIFFFTRPLNSAFHFTWLFNEKSIPGLIVYALLFGAWILTSFTQRKSLTVADRLKYFMKVFCFFGLIYLPSLVVKENYASNRTLLALNLAVFFVVMDTLFTAISHNKMKRYAVAFLSFFFILNAWYNFNRQFLAPVKKEYAQVRKFVEDNYNADTDTVYFIRPWEDFFEKKFAVTRSWDEFGVPSTFFEWTPEFLVKQIVFEKTGNRRVAEKLVVKNWLGQEAFLTSAAPISQKTLIINTEKIMNAE
ncbi:MAG: hypothetical protein JWM28_2492 [Chitinophagaceae bacterium]|nr:hypothetical protein [Chitinophagaceae bacterium]